MATTHFSGPLEVGAEGAFNVKAGNTQGVVLTFDGFGTAAVSGATMTVSPELTPESGYIRVDIGGTIYQIPIYAE